MGGKGEMGKKESKEDVGTEGEEEGNEGGGVGGELESALTSRSSILLSHRQYALRQRVLATDTSLHRPHRPPLQILPASYLDLSSVSLCTSPISTMCLHFFLFSTLGLTFLNEHFQDFFILLHHFFHNPLFNSHHPIWCHGKSMGFL